MSVWATQRFAWAQMRARIGAHPLAFLTSVMAAAAAFFVPVLAATLPRAALDLRALVAPAMELNVFVAVGTAGPDVRALNQRLAALPEVANVTLIGRDAALAQLTETTDGRAAAAIAELKSNPLPDVLVAKVRVGVTPAALDAAVADIRQWPRVDSVAADMGWYRKAIAWGDLGRSAAIVIGSVGLWLILWTLIGAVRRLAHQPREEAEVLTLVGADPVVMRRPYAYLGGVTLASGMVVSLGAVSLTNVWLAPQLATLSTLYGQALPWVMPPVQVLLGLVLGAGLAGTALASVCWRLSGPR